MRRSTLVALLAVLAVVGAACTGGDGEPEEPTEAAEATDAAMEDDPAAVRALEAAIDATIAAGSARFTMTVGQGDDPTRGQEVAKGVEDFAAQRRQVTFSGPQGELEAIVDGAATYVHLPFIEGAEWVRLDLGELGAGVVGGPIGLPLRDAGGALELLGDAAGEVRRVGTEAVDGVETTRYAVTVDLREAAEQADAGGEDDLGTAFARSGARRLDLQVWAAELVRRVAYTLETEGVDASVGDATASAGGPVTATFDYTDFGTDVAIEVPADQEVLDLDEQAIADRLERLGGGDR